jgi:ribosome-binding factor A
MKSFRPERVAHLVRAVVSDAISHKLSDPRIEPFSSVTRVEVSRDLEHAKVFVSVMGDTSVRRRTMNGLDSAAGHIQRLVARQLPIRHCPQLSFHLDESIKRAVETIQLIDETMAEYREPGAPGAVSDQDTAFGGSSGEGA